MDPVTLYQLLNEIKNFISEKQSQTDKQETNWFRKSLSNTLKDIKETTGVSEIILNEVLEKLDDIHAQLGQKNVKESMMIDVLKSYIDNDVKQMIEGDLCDQQKWMLIHMYHNGFSFSNTIGGNRWLPEPNLKVDDLIDLCDRKLVRHYNDQYLLTRKGKEAVEKGFIFTSHWTYVDLATGTQTDLPISSSNLQILVEKKKELEKVKGEPNWSVESLNAYEGDWFNFQRPNGVTRKMFVKNGSLDFE